MAGTIVANTLNTDTVGGVFTTQNAVTGIAKAWVNFSGTTANSSYNISSITNPSTGTFTLTFTTPMPNVNYCIQITSSFASGIREDVFGIVYNDAPYTPTTTAFTVKFYRADTNAAVNPTFGYVAVLSS